MQRLLTAIFGIVLCGTISGAAVFPQEQNEGADNSVAANMKRRAMALVASGREGKAIPLHETNLLDWKDKSRNVAAGSLWVWGKTGRPAALLSLYHYRDNPAAGATRRWYYEMTALSSKIAAVKHDSWAWTPDDRKLEFRPIPEAPEPSLTADVRLRQLQLLAHQFAAVQEDKTRGKIFFLPLYPDVLHRYDDKAGGIVDGALFVFVHETNPEILMLLECQKDDSGRSAWHVAFAPVAANEILVYHVDDEIYRGQPQVNISPSTPYSIQHVLEQLP